jgi:hypothetical protein
MDPQTSFLTLCTTCASATWDSSSVARGIYWKAKDPVDYPLGSPLGIVLAGGNNARDVNGNLIIPNLLRGACGCLSTPGIGLVVSQPPALVGIPPTLAWSTPAAITYGTALSGTQLNATASVAGTFVYTPAAGTVPVAGSQTLSVTFTPMDTTDYTIATTTVTLLVNKAAPGITWANPTAITYGTALSSTQLNATASVPGAFSYTPAVGTVLRAGSQTLSVTFTPTDTTDYNSATATTTLTVNKATPSITWATPAAIFYGTALSSTQLNAKASVTGTFSYNPAAGTVPVVGKQTLSATFTPGDTTDYNTASATVTLLVNPDIAPVCKVYDNANPPYMSYQAMGSGIVKLTFTTNYNFNVTTTPAPDAFSPAIPSQPYPVPTGTIATYNVPNMSLITVAAVWLDHTKGAQLVVAATDAGGKSVSCDPIQTTVTRMKQDDGVQTFTQVSSDEHYVHIENGGLRQLDIIVNNVTFKVKRMTDDEIAVVDIQSAMTAGNTNTITLVPKGKKGDSADVLIGPTP